MFSTLEIEAPKTELAARRSSPRVHSLPQEEVVSLEINFRGFTSTFILAEMFFGGLEELDTALVSCIDRFSKNYLLSPDSEEQFPLRVALNSARNSLLVAIRALNAVLRDDRFLSEEEVELNGNGPNPALMFELQKKTTPALKEDLSSEPLEERLLSVTNFSSFMEEGSVEILRRLSGKAHKLPCSRSVVFVIQALQERAEGIRVILERETGKRLTQNNFRTLPKRKPPEAQVQRPVSKVTFTAPVESKPVPVKPVSPKSQRTTPAETEKIESMKSESKARKKKIASPTPRRDAPALQTTKPEQQDTLSAKPKVFCLAKPLNEEPRKDVIQTLHINPELENLSRLSASLMSIVKAQFLFPNSDSESASKRAQLSTRDQQMLQALEGGYERVRVAEFRSSSREIQVGSTVCSALELLIAEAQSARLPRKLLLESTQVLGMYLNTCSQPPQAVG